MTIEQELIAWQIGYILWAIGFIILFVVVRQDEKVRKTLQKNRILITKKGTYTFTPKENIQ